MPKSILDSSRQRYLDELIACTRPEDFTDDEYKLAKEALDEFEVNFRIWNGAANLDEGDDE